MKPMMIFLGIVLTIAAALFWREIWGIFAGMTVLEAMGIILKFMLNGIVAILAGYALKLLPEYVRPWLRLRRAEGRRRIKDGRRQKAEGGMQRAPRLNLNSLVMALLRNATPSALSGTSPKLRSARNLGEEEQREPVIHLDL